MLLTIHGGLDGICWLSFSIERPEDEEVVRLGIEAKTELGEGEGEVSDFLCNYWVEAG